MRLTRSGRPSCRSGTSARWTRGARCWWTTFGGRARRGRRYASSRKPFRLELGRHVLVGKLDRVDEATGRDAADCGLQDGAHPAPRARHVPARYVSARPRRQDGRAGLADRLRILAPRHPVRRRGRTIGTSGGRSIGWTRCWQPWKATTRSPRGQATILGNAITPPTAHARTARPLPIPFAAPEGHSRSGCSAPPARPWARGRCSTPCSRAWSETNPRPRHRRSPFRNQRP